jgi:hypothetical protein
MNGYAWYNVSAENGHENGSKAAANLAKGMTPEQIAEAQALSAKWFELYQPKE